MRNKIIDEVVETERTYVSLLGLMITVKHSSRTFRLFFLMIFFLTQEFYEPLQKQPFIRPGDVNSIFSNIRLILNVSKTLLEGLEAKKKKW